MKKLISLSIFLILMISCQSDITGSDKAVEVNQISEARIGGVGVGIGVDVTGVHNAKAHYKKTIIPGTYANGWQSTYFYGYSTGSSTESCAKAKLNAKNAMPSGAIFVYSTCN
jgi:hypothetical protein